MWLQGPMRGEGDATNMVEQVGKWGWVEETESGSADCRVGAEVGVEVQHQLGPQVGAELQT